MQVSCISLTPTITGQLIKHCIPYTRTNSQYKAFDFFYSSHIIKNQVVDFSCERVLNLPGVSLPLSGSGNALEITQVLKMMLGKTLYTQNVCICSFACITCMVGPFMMISILPLFSHFFKL